MTAPVESGTVAKQARERDLFRRLLDLGRQRDLLPLLRQALALIVDLAEVRHGYLELHDDDDAADTPPRWWIAHGFSQDEIQTVRAAISRGIISEALATGRTVATPSALLDPRFGERESVRLAKIEAVLCAPVGEDPPRGVLYLQGRAAPGPFTDEDVERVEFATAHLAPLVSRLLAEQRLQQRDDPTLPMRGALRLEDVIGHSAALASCLKQVALVAPLDLTVLLTGDSGTGKSQLARIIHDNSPRAGHPFVELNCGALPETLIESELFGAMAGAHSTATHRIEGKVGAAEHGTLLLDEIAEVPLAAQAKLLQLIQSKQYYPLGSSKPLQADVRVIAATNVDLPRAVAERRFREDLLYRLQVLPLRVPSLAERRDDIRDLATHFCETACRQHGLPHLELTANGQRAVESAEWPGNIRQLRHAMEAAAIRCAGEGRTRIEREDLFPGATAPAPESASPTFQEATRRFQANLLRQTLEETGWNVVETARRLDLARSHIYNLIRAFGLERRSS